MGRGFHGLRTGICLMMCLALFAPIASAQVNPVEPEVHVTCDAGDEITAEPNRERGGYVFCYIENQNSYDVTVEVTWDWDHIVAYRDVDNGESITVGANNQIEVQINLMVDPATPAGSATFDFHTQVTEYMMGLMTCDTCEKKTRSMEFDITPWFSLDVSIVDSNMPGVQSQKRFDVCDPEVLEGENRVEVEIEIESNVQNVEVQAQMAFIGGHEDDDYQDLISSESELAIEQLPSGEGIVRMEVGVDMDPGFSERKDIMLAASLWIEAVVTDCSEKWYCSDSKGFNSWCLPDEIGTESDGEEAEEEGEAAEPVEDGGLLPHPSMVSTALMLLGVALLRRRD